MRPTGASLKLQGLGDRNAHFEGASSPATKGKYKNTRTRHKAHCPEPLQLERSPETSPASAAPSPASPAEACGGTPPAPSPGARPGSPEHAPLIFRKPSWASAPPGLVLLQTHRAGRYCQLSGCKGLPYLQPPLTASHWFMLLRGQFASPGERGAVSGGAWEWGWWGLWFLPCKATALCQPWLSNCVGPLGTWGGGRGGGPRGQGGPGQQPHCEKQSQGR